MKWLACPFWSLSAPRRNNLQRLVADTPAEASPAPIARPGALRYIWRTAGGSILCSAMVTSRCRSKDAIALALENNLDLELVRYAPRLAGRTCSAPKPEASLRGIPLSVREGPAGLGGPAAGPNGTLRRRQYTGAECAAPDRECRPTSRSSVRCPSLPGRRFPASIRRSSATSAGITRPIRRTVRSSRTCDR